MPWPLPPHPVQPTRTGTTVGSSDPFEVVVIQVFVVQSSLETVVGVNVSGGAVRVEVIPSSSDLVVEMGPEAEVIVASLVVSVFLGGDEFVTVGTAMSSFVVLSLVWIAEFEPEGSCLGASDPDGLDSIG